jgi:hypothetical protein
LGHDKPDVGKEWRFWDMFDKLKDFITIQAARITGRPVQITRTTSDGETAINVSKDGHTQIASARGRNSAAINISEADDGKTVTISIRK